MAITHTLIWGIRKEMYLYNNLDYTLQIKQQLYKQKNCIHKRIDVPKISNYF